MGEGGESASQEVTRRDPGPEPPLAAPTPPGSGAPSLTDSGRQRPRIGRFVIFGELGRGGYGVVYRAKDPTLGRACAVKLLREECADAPARERLIREARSVARLGKHPNIVQVHEAGTTPEGQVYIAMELVEGESLERIAARRRVGWEEAAAIARKVALGLEHAHRHGVIHRDMKPSNVILDSSGEPQITDFGVAKDLQSGSASITRKGSAVGTPAFMSPEQAQALAVDARSDVYGVGALLHALIKGKPPFAAPHVAIILAKVIHRNPPRLRNRKNKCPRDLETVVLKAMDKDPARRYPSAEALAADLGRVLDGEACEASRPGTFERLWRDVQRRPRNLIIFLALCGAGFLTYRYREEMETREALERRERHLAEEERVRLFLTQLGTVTSPPERLRICDEAARRFPGSWQPHYERGLIERDLALSRAGAGAEAQALEHYRSAEASFTRAAERNPDAAYAYFFRGIVRSEGLQDRSGAERDLETALARSPEGGVAEIVRTVRAAGASDEDLAALSKAVERHPRLPILRETRAALHLVRGEDEAALADAEAALAGAPLSASLHACRALALSGLGRIELAKGAAERAIALAPEEPLGYEARAASAAALERAAAQADLERAASLAPPGAEALPCFRALRAAVRARFEGR